MNWRIKATIQNAVSRLPPAVSYAAYYWLQRHAGGLRRVNPMEHFAAAAELCARIHRAGRDPADGVFLEIGTGRRVNMPLAFWLLGARKTVTVDLNPYLREELVREDVAYLCEHPEETGRALGAGLDRERFRGLRMLAKTRWRLEDLLRFCGVEYQAPCDARRLPYAEGVVDFHVSYNVFEHIPPEVLREIVREGSRVAGHGGLFVHRVDYSDHFAHSDPAITPLNFLRFDARRWERIAGNRYMYMNRLRSDDLAALLEGLGHRLLLHEPTVDAALLPLIRQGLPLDGAFREKSETVLATTSSWVVSAPA